MNTNKLTFNGINALTGDYGLPPMTSAELATHITDGAVGQATAIEAGLDQDRAAALAGLAGWRQAPWKTARAMTPGVAGGLPAWPASWQTYYLPMQMPHRSASKPLKTNSRSNR